MGFEVEVKYRLVDSGELVRRLRDRAAVELPEIHQEDTYLSHPARDFAITREALRIRRVGNENRITYKGPRHTGPTKTREEIEIRFSDGDEACRQLLHLFENLGFRPVATIRKSRAPFHLTAEGRAIEVVLDRAEGLGAFAEIETLAAALADLPAAQAAVLAVASELGLTDVEPRSYLRMALEARLSARPGVAPGAGVSPGAAATWNAGVEPAATSESSGAKKPPIEGAECRTESFPFRPPRSHFSLDWDGHTE